MTVACDRFNKSEAEIRTGLCLLTKFKSRLTTNWKQSDCNVSFWKIHIKTYWLNLINLLKINTADNLIDWKLFNQLKWKFYFKLKSVPQTSVRLFFISFPLMEVQLGRLDATDNRTTSQTKETIAEEKAIARWWVDLTEKRSPSQVRTRSSRVTVDCCFLWGRKSVAVFPVPLIVKVGV